MQMGAPAESVLQMIPAAQVPTGANVDEQPIVRPSDSPVVKTEHTFVEIRLVVEQTRVVADVVGLEVVEESELVEVVLELVVDEGVLEVGEGVLEEVESVADDSVVESVVVVASVLEGAAEVAAALLWEGSFAADDFCVAFPVVSGVVEP